LLCLITFTSAIPTPGPHPHHQGHMQRRVIVLILGPIRSFNYTAPSIEKHLLNVLDADVGMCVNGDDPKNLTKTWFSDRVVFRHFSSQEAVKMPQIIDHACPTNCTFEKFPYTKLLVTASNISDHFKLLHMRAVYDQMREWFSCYHHLLRNEERVGHYYNTIVKIRFDMAFYYDFPYIEYFRSNPRHDGDGGTIEKVAFFPDEGELSKRFPSQSYGGIEDRVWVSNRAAAEVLFSSLVGAYFLSQYDELMCNLTLPRHKPENLHHMLKELANPEAFVLVHLEIHNVTIRRDLDVIYGLLSEDGCMRYRGINASSVAIWRANGFEPDMYADNKEACVMHTFPW